MCCQPLAADGRGVGHVDSQDNLASADAFFRRHMFALECDVAVVAETTALILILS